MTRKGDQSDTSFSIIVRVVEVDSHYEHARQSGAQIVSPPADYPYRERQYTAQDPGGHCWTFSQTMRMWIQKAGGAH